MPMAVVAGASHTLQYVNPTFCRLTGKSKEELIGTMFSVAVPMAGECLALLERVERSGSAETYAGHESLTFQSPCWPYAAWPILSLVEGSRVGIMIQMSERESLLLQAADMNQALILGSVRQHELTEEAVRLNEELQRANENLRQFAFAASHDLQEPLRMITSYSQLLIRGYRDRLDGEAAVCVDFIKEGTSHMRNLLQDLLSYTETGADSGEKQPVDLANVFEKVSQNLRRAIEETGSKVTSTELPIVQGHEARFVQLFQNLIGNAIKYHGADSPVIHVAAERRDSEWLISVKDNGMGIEQEHHQRIFGVFKRLHGKTIPGTGMGLAICQRVVERYGGRIWVESQLGRGTVFYFTLPRNEVIP